MNMKSPFFQVGQVVRAKPVGKKRYTMAVIEEIQLCKSREPHIPLSQPLYWIRFAGIGYLGGRWESELEPRP